MTGLAFVRVAVTVGPVRACADAGSLVQVVVGGTDADVPARDFCAGPAGVDGACVGAAVGVNGVSVVAFLVSDSIAVAMFWCVGGFAISVSGFGEVD